MLNYASRKDTATETLKEGKETMDMFITYVEKKKNREKDVAELSV